ncbi:ribonuclease III [Patescibacteria group bacterium]|nr:ribonuclease III [Patescibacteria group bacterium]
MGEKDFNRFEQQNGLTFENKNLLVQAFTHRSYLNENRDAKLEHNERLEFLGDAVLELVVTDYLFKNFENKAEGELTAYRSALVNTTMLASVAMKLGMNDYLLLSRGESKDEGRARQYILADTFEALIGAFYLDQGYDKVAEFISKNLLSLLGTIVEKRLWQDSKSHFQEEAQERTGITPTYSTVKEIGPDHDKRFVVAVYLNDEHVVEGEGQSKQEAEQAAAEKALQSKRW